MDNSKVMAEYIELEKKLGRVDVKLESVGTKLEQILFLLSGTALDRKAGLIAKVEEQGDEIRDLTKQVYHLKRWQDRAVWVGVGAGIPATVGTLELFKIIFK